MAPEIVEDPELGVMHWDNDQYANVWILKRHTLFNGVELKIEIKPEYDTRTISPLQMAAAKIALSFPTDSLSKSAPAVLQNCEACGTDLLDDHKALDIQNPIDVWRYVSLEKIVVPPHESSGVIIPSFMVYGECLWEPEHGLEIRFRNGYADESDQQGHIQI